MLFNNGDRIVFAGDSVTDVGRAFPLGEGETGLGNGYVHIIKNMLDAWYPEINIRVTNAGISGDTSRDLLARFDNDVLALNPNWAVICIGINDVWRQFDCPAMLNLQVMPDEYEKNVETMILKVKDSVKGIFILSPYYMEPNRADFMRARMQEYVDICARLAAEYGCIFVDFQAMYDRYFAYKHSALIAWDRVHPNQIGATLMAKEWLAKCGFDYDHTQEG